MNINLSSVFGSSKSETSSSEGATASSESKDSEGFLSKLTSLISGEGEKGSDEKGKVEESAQSSSADKSSSTEKSLSTYGESSSSEEAKAEIKKSSESTDEVLKQADASDDEEKSVSSAEKSKESNELGDTKETKTSQVSSAEKNTQSDSDTVKSSEAESVDTGKQTQQKVSAEESEKAQATKAKQETDEMLGRINESNNALQSKDGKPLPQQEGEKVISDGEPKDPKVVAAAVAAKSQAGSNDSVVGDGKVAQQSPNQFAASSEQPANAQQSDNIPESAKRFIQQDPSTHQVKGANSQADAEANQNAGIKAATAAAVVGQKPEEGALTKAPQGEASIVSSGVEELTPGEEGSVKAAAALGVGAAAQGDVKSAQSVQVTGSPQVSSAGASGVTSGGAGTGAAVAAGAIAWNSTEQTDPSAAQAQDAQGNKAKQAAVAASVHQALQQQGAQQTATAINADKAAMTQMASSMPSDLSQAQMQQLVAANMAPQVPQQQLNNQAALKAALGAKGVSSLAKGQDKQDVTGAQQFAGAAGAQQGPNSLQARVESAAQAQTPMMLTKEAAGDQVAERVQMMMSKNLKNIDIRLDPPELGRMQIRMNMNGDGTAVHFTVANQQARDVIEQSMPRLREMLAQQGVQLNDTSVQQQSAGQQQGRYSAQNGNNAQGSGNEAAGMEENLDTDVNLDLNVATKRDGISYYA
ncbi:flagellar hook-length control protein FliK [Vibrio paucivorans]